MQDRYKLRESVKPEFQSTFRRYRAFQSFSKEIPVISTDRPETLLPLLFMPITDRSGNPEDQEICLSKIPGYLDWFEITVSEISAAD